MVISMEHKVSSNCIIDEAFSILIKVYKDIDKILFTINELNGKNINHIQDNGIDLIYIITCEKTKLDIRITTSGCGGNLHKGKLFELYKSIDENFYKIIFCYVESLLKEKYDFKSKNISLIDYILPKKELLEINPYYYSRIIQGQINKNIYSNNIISI